MHILTKSVDDLLYAVDAAALGLVSCSTSWFSEPALGFGPACRTALAAQTSTRRKESRPILASELRAAACTWLIFRLRRRYKKEPTSSFDGVSRSAALPDLPDPGWAWQRDYYACAVHAFDPEVQRAAEKLGTHGPWPNAVAETQLGTSALRFDEGDLLQVEAKVDAAWLYGHAAKDPERAGFFPENRVRRLGTGRVPSQPPHPLAHQHLLERGFEVKAKSSYQPDDIEAKRFLRVLAGDFLEILCASEGWLYGRTLKAPTEFGFFPETCLAEELSAKAAACAGPRLAAAGTASWTEGAEAFEPDRAQPPSRPEGKPVRSLSRQLTSAIASTLCTGSFQVNRS
eukprot:s4869_g2.t2